VKVDYPSIDEETEIVQMTTRPQQVDYEQVLTGPQILEIQDLVRRVPISDHVVRYVLRLVRATRVSTQEASEAVRSRLAWGAGPRASQYLVLAAKAHALLEGRLYVATEDVRAVAHPVLRHRLITTYGAEAEGWTTDRIIDELMERTAAGDGQVFQDERLPNALET
jgi:MoxR-like ATPase